MVLRVHWMGLAAALFAVSCGQILGIDEFRDQPSPSSSTGGGGSGAASTGGTGATGGVGASGGEGGMPLPGAVGCASEPVQVFTPALLMADDLDGDHVVLAPRPDGSVHVAVAYTAGAASGLAARTFSAGGALSPIRTRDAGAAFKVVDGNASASALELFGYRDDVILRFKGTSDAQGVAMLSAPEIADAPDGQPGGGGPQEGCQGIDFISFSLTPPSDPDDGVAVTCDNAFFTGEPGLLGLWQFSSVPPAAEVHAYYNQLPGHFFQTGLDYYFGSNEYEAVGIMSRKRLNLATGGLTGTTEPQVVARLGDNMFALAGFRADTGEEQVWAAFATPQAFVDAFPSGFPSMGIGPFNQIAALDAVPKASLPSVDAGSVVFAGVTTKGSTTLRVYRFIDGGPPSHDLDVYIPAGDVQLEAWAAAPLGAGKALVAWSAIEAGTRVVRACPVDLP